MTEPAAPRAPELPALTSIRFFAAIAVVAPAAAAEGKSDGTVGDLLVTLKVEVPAHLSDAARSALLEYAEKSGQSNPRTALFGS